MTKENKRTTLIGKSLIETIREQIQKEQEKNEEDEENHSTVVDEKRLDWIWSVISELRLKSVTANDIIQERDGTLRGPTHDFDIVEAMDQRLVTGTLFSDIVKIFLKKILASGLDVYREQQKRRHEHEQETMKQEQQQQQGNKTEGEAQTAIEKLLVPVHIYEGIQKTLAFDFLTNQYMGSPATPPLSETQLLQISQQKRKQEEDEDEDIVMNETTN